MLDDRLDLLQGWIRAHAEVGAGLVGHSLGSSPPAGPQKVGPNDRGPLVGGHLDQRGGVTFLATDHHTSSGSTHIADPLGLTGEGDQEVLAVVPHPHKGGAVDHPGATTGDLQDDHVLRNDLPPDEQRAEPLETQVEVRWPPVANPVAVVDRSEEPLPSRFAG